jgi:hypothetical protein
MKHLTTFIFLLTFGQAIGQKKQCYCDKDTSMNGATTNCKTTVFKNKSKLYWQYNCKRIWLTLEDVKGRKTVIDEVDVELFGYTYRLGFHLFKEFDKTLLFRSGCPANGPCMYSLIDKSTGKLIKKFGQLICIDTDIREDKKYQFDFVVYYSDNYDKLKIYNIYSNQILTIPFNAKQNNLTAVIPEQQFDKMKLNGNILTIFYTTTENKELNLKIDLTNKKYSRQHGFVASGG